MIKITQSANSTITIADSGTSGVYGTSGTTTTIALRTDCEVFVFDTNVYATSTITRVLRTVMIANKFTGKALATVTTETLDPASTSYNSNMDTYANNLITVLYA